jgi:hypothetical protein
MTKEATDEQDGGVDCREEDLVVRSRWAGVYDGTEKGQHHDDRRRARRLHSLGRKLHQPHTMQYMEGHMRDGHGERHRGGGVIIIFRKSRDTSRESPSMCVIIRGGIIKGGR